MLDGLTRARLKQQSPALGAAMWILAIAGPVLLTLTATHSSLFRGGFQFCSLVLVVALAVVRGMRPALTALLLAVAGQALFVAPVYMSMSARVSMGLLASVTALAGFAIAGIGVSKLTGKFAHLAAEQAAYRRVAVLVAHAAPEQELFAAATEEAGRLMGADYVRLGKYESGKLVGLAAWRRTPGNFRASGRWPLFRSLTKAASQADHWARIDDLAGACGPFAEDARAHGVRSAAVLPIRVGGRLWGLLIVGSTMRQAPQACRRSCADSFADLLGAAVSNADSLAQLVASRARVLAAADEARRQIERDLHDGAQQRLVSLAFSVQAAQAAVPPMSGHLGEKLGDVADELTSVLDDLRELARGIHPSVLSEGGLVPALKTLARRSVVPVELNMQVAERLPEPVEIAAYYVICEALANAAKHANASMVQVGAELAGDALHLRVADDGDGGADPALGSGLMGLKDRVEALGGTIAVSSPVGEGTCLDADLPLAA